MILDIRIHIHKTETPLSHDSFYSQVNVNETDSIADISRPHEAKNITTKIWIFFTTPSWWCQGRRAAHTNFLT